MVLWTVITALSMFGYAWLAYAGHAQAINSRFDWVQAQLGIMGSICIGLWGLAALVLLRYARRLGATALLFYSAFGLLVYGGPLINDFVSEIDALFLVRLPEEYRSTTTVFYVAAQRIDVASYLAYSWVAVLFLLTAVWCLNRLFPNFAEVQRKVGVKVTAVAILISISPYLGKAYLLTTIPPIRSVNVAHYSVSESTTAFLQAQLDLYRKEILSDGEQLGRLAKNCPSVKGPLSAYRKAVMMLDDLRVKNEQSLKADHLEKLSSFAFGWKNVEERLSALQRAGRIHTRMMLVLTLLAAAFLVLVLPAHRVPGWAKNVSMVAAGAVMAGWFPLV